MPPDAASSSRAPASATARLAARIAELGPARDGLGAWDRRLSSLRVVTFLAAAAAWARRAHLGGVAAAADGADPGPAATVAWAATAVFALWVVAQRAVATRIRDLDARLAALSQAVARSRHDWPALAGRRGVVLPAWASDTQRQLAGDLDLAGEGRSLWTLVGTAEVTLGHEVLWRWLLEPADGSAMAARQAAARATAEQLPLRETLAVLAGRERGARAAPLDLATLAAWGTAAPLLAPGRVRAALAACHLAVAAAAAALALEWAGPLPLFTSLAGQFLLARLIGRRVAAVVAAAAAPSRVLARLAGRLAPLMGARVDDPSWRAELDALAAGGPGAAPRALRGLDRLCRMADAAANQVLAPIAALVLWVPHAACGIEAWRRRHGAELGGWLTALARLEAYVLAGGYAFEHPGDAWPRAADGAAAASFSAADLAHPLIAAGERVGNDVELGPEAPALMVSGSNMSGKSTLLRAVGLAAVMARAGLPVAAGRLTLGRLEVASSMRIADSLAAGTSHFWAEVQAIKRVCDAAAQRPPALFLLDEILHGTNSLDRRVGALAVLAHLERQGAIGIITTHDLTLTAGSGAPKLRNAHFVDSVEGGRAHFDYRCRPGVVTHSNALRLMRLAGLDVEAGAPPEEKL